MQLRWLYLCRSFFNAFSWPPETICFLSTVPTPMLRSFSRAPTQTRFFREACNLWTPICRVESKMDWRGRGVRQERALRERAARITSVFIFDMRARKRSARPELTGKAAPPRGRGAQGRDPQKSSGNCGGQIRAIGHRGVQMRNQFTIKFGTGHAHWGGNGN